ncbi:MAG: type III-B CRISPR module RAMP protein Cmr4 [Syntrophaceticus schinkii]|nr:type III-B CRISPR module RAMP protein Cmr4 [Syntrophaceticus schinkii]MDD4262745.1 type III-B CRISPR module RAMP protein Cmr4 [Syntrophaceticus schinkii]
MNTVLVGLLSETSIHPGAESSGGVVDLPVAREATTDYPVLMGSGLKGALRDIYVQSNGEKEAKTVFGDHDGAGGISVTDGRLLLLPVRSLTGHYRWVTCPYILERFQRDLALAGLNAASFDIPNVEQNEAVAAVGGDIYLEELSFEVLENKKAIESICQVMADLIYHQSVKERLTNQVVVITDDEFKYFARFGLPVNARNVLNDKTKTSKNLWYEETVPADTLFYTLIIPRPGQEEQLNKVQKVFIKRPYLQVGGNETVGQGWCVISWLAKEESI